MYLHELFMEDVNGVTSLTTNILEIDVIM